MPLSLYVAFHFLGTVKTSTSNGTRTRGDLNDSRTLKHGAGTLSEASLYKQKPFENTVHQLEVEVQKLTPHKQVSSDRCGPGPPLTHHISAIW